MSQKVYHIAVLDTATDLDGPGEIKMQQSILEYIKELNATNTLGVQFKALPITRKDFYGSHVLCTQFAVALGELRRELNVLNAHKLNTLSLRMSALSNMDVQARGDFA